MPDTCVGMTTKTLREELDRLVTEIQAIQTRINELAAKLMVTTKEEMKHEALRTKTAQGHS